MNLKWGKCIAGGDGNLCLQAPNDGDNAKWELVEVTKGQYYIKDRKNGKYIYSGYNYDGKAYHGDFDQSHLDNYLWNTSVRYSDPNTLGGDVFILVNEAHNRNYGIVAGSDSDDGHVYLQDYPYESYAEWGLIIAS